MTTSARFAAERMATARPFVRFAAAEKKAAAARSRPGTTEWTVAPFCASSASCSKGSAPPGSPSGNASPPPARPWGGASAMRMTTFVASGRQSQASVSARAYEARR